MVEPDTAQSLHKSLVVATGAGGVLEFLSSNSSGLTVLVVIISGAFSIVFGYINAKANRERNRISKRDLIDAIIHDLHIAGKSEQDIAEILSFIQK